MAIASRLTMPSGAWWDIASEYTWGMAKSMPQAETDTMDHVLLAMTVAWSYDAPVTYASLQDLPARDVAVALAEVVRITAPLLAPTASG